MTKPPVLLWPAFRGPVIQYRSLGSWDRKGRSHVVGSQHTVFLVQKQQPPRIAAGCVSVRLRW